MNITKFEPKYRDDLIFMILEAKNALGRVPGLNEDLLDIQKNYFDKGDMFWIALDDNDRVIGSVGYNSIANSDDVVLHRLFVKYNLKHQGIGTALLKTAEQWAKENNIEVILLNSGLPREDAHAFYESQGYFKKSYGFIKKI